MKRLLSGLIVVFGALNLQASDAPVRPIDAPEAYQLGYGEGYTAGKDAGLVRGATERRLNVGDREQHRSLSSELIDIQTEEATSEGQAKLAAEYYHVRFADDDALRSFRQGYRAGFAAGWTDGHQEGFALHAAPMPENPHLDIPVD